MAATAPKSAEDKPGRAPTSFSTRANERPPDGGGSVSDAGTPGPCPAPTAPRRPATSPHFRSHSHRPDRTHRAPRSDQRCPAWPPLPPPQLPAASHAAATSLWPRSRQLEATRCHSGSEQFSWATHAPHTGRSHCTAPSVAMQKRTAISRNPQDSAHARRGLEIGTPARSCIALAPHTRALQRTEK